MRGNRVLFVGQAECHEFIRAFFPPGTLSAMHASGIGKAILSRLSTDQVAAVVAQHGLDRFTPRTLVSPATLRADLSLSAKRGYAIDEEERNPGMRCIAAPIVDATGEVVAGLSVSGPITRMSEARTGEVAQAVMQAAAEVSAKLGGDPGLPGARIAG